MTLRLPPIDDYRKPFIEPFGVAALWMGRLEDKVIEFCALRFEHSGNLGQPDPPRTPPQSPQGKAAERLRNWDSKFIDECVRAVAEGDAANDLRKLMDRINSARKRRHRLVHDHVDISLEVDAEDEDGTPVRLLPIPLLAGFLKNGKLPTERYIELITPKDVADFAWKIYGLWGELDVWVEKIQRDRRSSAEHA